MCKPRGGLELPQRLPAVTGTSSAQCFEPADGVFNPAHTTLQTGVRARVDTNVVARHSKLQGDSVTHEAKAHHRNPVDFISFHRRNLDRERLAKMAGLVCPPNGGCLIS